jgi:hypothetical protein
LQPDEVYLAGLEPGTYKFETAKLALQQAKLNYDYDLKAYNDRRKGDGKDEEAEEAKKKDVAALLERYNALEKELVSKWHAKTFKELHPDIEGPEPNKPYRYEPWKRPPFEIKFGFSLPDLTEERRQGCIDLFQAAWIGNVERIKELTTSMWGPNKDRLPLQITILDGQNMNPFSIAVARGHLDTGRTIMEIARAQYDPETTEEDVRERYDMMTEDYDDPYYSDELSEDESDDSEGIQVRREVVSEKFTIDNVGEAVTKVASKTKPTWFLNASCSVSEFIE